MIKFLPYIIFLGGVLAFVIGVYFYGKKHGHDICELKYATIQLEAEGSHESKEREVIRLPVTELKRRYCRWVRDSEAECLQADIPIR